MSKPKNSSRALVVLGVVMVVNALSYGVIIPLLYPYASRFGIGPFMLSVLFSSYSLFQFISTPIIGRLSDKYGRKPLLLYSLFGSGVSLVMFAMANSIWMLLISRMLDGITGGNMSVAQAIIADSTEGKDRAKAFGILGASFGFGFLFGPAIGGILSQYSMTLPFWFAAGLAFIGAAFGALVLEETNTLRHQHIAQKEPLINIGKIIEAFKSPLIGVLLMLTFLSTFGHNVFVLGFQSFSVDVLKLSTTTIGILFAMIGFISILMQGGGVAWMLKQFKSKQQLLTTSLLLCGVVVSLLTFTNHINPFVAINVVYMIVFAPQMIIMTSLISEKTHAEDQGGVLGINQSVMSMGQIIGPLAAGLVATKSVPAVFLLAGVVFVVAGAFSVRAARTKGQFDL